MPLRWVKKYYFWICVSSSNVIVFIVILIFSLLSIDDNRNLREFILFFHDNVYCTLIPQHYYVNAHFPVACSVT